MINLLSPKIGFGIAGALLVGGLIYTVNDYIHLKSAYKVAQKTISVLEHKRQVTDSAMIVVEKKQNDIFTRSNKALLQMDKEGYLLTGDGLNPVWLRATAKNDSHAANPVKSSG